MNTVTKSKFERAIELNLDGVQFFSVGACRGCEECGTKDPMTKCKACDGYGTQIDALDHVEWECPVCNGDGEVPMEITDDDLQSAEEPHFSWQSCDSCGSSLGGDRHPAHGYIRGKLVHFNICTDCLMYHANGDLPEEKE